VPFRLFHAALSGVYREIDRSAFFNPLNALEFRPEFDRIKSAQVLELIRSGPGPRSASPRRPHVPVAVSDAALPHARHPHFGGATLRPISCCYLSRVPSAKMSGDEREVTQHPKQRQEREGDEAMRFGPGRCGSAPAPGRS